MTGQRRGQLLDTQATRTSATTSTPQSSGLYGDNHTSRHTQKQRSAITWRPCLGISFTTPRTRGLNSKRVQHNIAFCFEKKRSACLFVVTDSGGELGLFWFGKPIRIDKHEQMSDQCDQDASASFGGNEMFHDCFLASCFKFYFDNPKFRTFQKYFVKIWSGDSQGNF